MISVLPIRVLTLFVREDKGRPLIGDAVCGGCLPCIILFFVQFVG